MDIHSGVIAIMIMAALIAIFSLWRGLRALQSARKMTFYRLRRQREAGGWRLLGLGILLILFAFALPLYGEPIAYDYFPPSPTPSLTPTVTIVPSITLSPTITLTPTITDTPNVTDTATITPTPYVPLAMMALFQSSITPNPGAVFSPLLFSTKLDNSQAVDPNTVFQNPVGRMYAVFSYDQMSPGAQWTALWVRDGEIIHYETKPWDGATGGFGFTDWNPTPDQWAIGKYEVQIFVGLDWKVVGRFLVQGAPPTAAPTLSPTSTPTPSKTLIPSATFTPTSTPRPSVTPPSTRTP